MRKIALKKPKTEIILAGVVALLIITLIASAVVIKRKNDYISDVKAQISQNERDLAAADKEIEEFQKSIAEKDKVNSEITAEIEKAKSDKKKLEDENAALKKKIQTLSAQKANSGTVAVPLPNKIPPATKVCYLTFDDGPSDNTLKILEILKRYNVKATFFVMGTKTKLEYIKNIHNEGHTVGLHTNSHNYSQIYSSADAYFTDLNQISGRVEALIGVKPMVLRFPGGSSNSRAPRNMMPMLARLLTERGYSYFDWNVDSGDADRATASASYIINRVLNGARNKNSACVLMHDTAAKTTTAQALPAIIEGLKAMGYYFEPITPKTYGYHHKNWN